MRDGPKVVRANLTQSDNLVIEYVFEDRVDVRGNTFIKFSFNVYSTLLTTVFPACRYVLLTKMSLCEDLGHVWLAEPDAKRSTRVSFVMNYHIPHSSSGLATVSCFTRAAFANCSSELSTTQSSPTLSGTFSIQTRTNRSIIDHQYGVEVVLDGARLSDGNDIIYVLASYPYPLPSTFWLERHRVGGGNLSFDVGHPNQQSYIYMSEFRVKPFSRLFAYDPDLSITLLFDPSRIDETPSVAEQAAAAFGVGAIVGIVIAAAFAVVSIVIFKFKVFPCVLASQQ